MKRANSVELRKALECVQLLKNAGIDFVPIPVINEEEKKRLQLEFIDKLGKLEDICRD